MGVGTTGRANTWFKKKPEINEMETEEETVATVEEHVANYTHINL